MIFGLAQKSQRKRLGGQRPPEAQHAPQVYLLWVCQAFPRVNATCITPTLPLSLQHSVRVLHVLSHLVTEWVLTLSRDRVQGIGNFQIQD